MVNGIEAIAAKPASAAGGTLSVVSRLDPENDMVIVRVADSGIGIADDVVGRIFEPFFTTKTEGKGVGLGLAIAYGIVQRHRGTIEVDSVPGEGSVFTVALPRTQPSQAPAAAPLYGQHT